MTSARWADVEADIASAMRHFEAAVLAFRAGKPASRDDYWNVMAFQHAMYSGYSSFEAALERILAMLSEDLPVGRDWHRKLLVRASQALPHDRPALIGPDLLAAAEELLRFRHVTMHSYDSFDPVRAAPAVEAAERFLALVEAELVRTKSVLDPLADD